MAGGRDIHSCRQDNDEEGALILDQGPLCAIYSSDLLRDTAATHALNGEDNVNAGVQWGMDEMYVGNSGFHQGPNASAPHL